MLFNPDLMEMALWAIEKHKQEKQAFVPPGAPAGDPSAGGQPPPGGGVPPTDPSQMAAAGGGGAPPAAAGGMPDIQGLIQTTVQQAVQQAMGGQGGAPGMGGGMGGGAGGMMGKPGKPDPQAQGMDIFQIKKMLTHFFNIQGIPLPPDIMDGPNRDPQTGMPMPPGAPGSTSDPATAAQPAQPGGGQAQGGGIQPIQPMGGQGANPTMTPDASGGQAKMSHSLGEEYLYTTTNRASALAHLIKQLQLRDG